MACPQAFQFRGGEDGKSQAGGGAQIGRILYTLLFIGVFVRWSTDSITAMNIPRQQAPKGVQYFGRCRKNFFFYSVPKALTHQKYVPTNSNKFIL
jgi:hypothetical protein